MPARTSAWLLAAGLALALAGCQREHSGSPTGSSPATGNPAASARAGETGATQRTPGQGLQGGMGAGAATPSAPRAAASSSAPTGKDLPSGNPGTTYHSPGKS